MAGGLCIIDIAACIHGGFKLLQQQMHASCCFGIQAIVLQNPFSIIRRQRADGQTAAIIQIVFEGIDEVLVAALIFPAAPFEGAKGISCS